MRVGGPWSVGSDLRRAGAVRWMVRCCMTWWRPRSHCRCGSGLCGGNTQSGGHGIKTRRCPEKSVVTCEHGRDVGYHPFDVVLMLGAKECRSCCIKVSGSTNITGGGLRQKYVSRGAACDSAKVHQTQQHPRMVDQHRSQTNAPSTV